MTSVMILRLLALAFSLVAIVTAIFLPQPALAQTGDFTLFLTVYRNKIEPGQDNVLFLEVRNTGKTELTNIEFSSLASEGWIIEFEPATIDRLNPDNFQTVKVKVKPPTTIKGYDEVTLIAEAHGLRRVTNAWLRVETAISVWLWTGAAIAAVVVVAFIFIFVRMSHQ